MFAERQHLGRVTPSTALRPMCWNTRSLAAAALVVDVLAQSQHRAAAMLSVVVATIGEVDHRRRPHRPRCESAGQQSTIARLVTQTELVGPGVAQFGAVATMTDPGERRGHHGEHPDRGRHLAGVGDDLSGARGVHMLLQSAPALPWRGHGLIGRAWLTAITAPAASSAMPSSSPSTTAPSGDRFDQPTGSSLSAVLHAAHRRRAAPRRSARHCPPAPR